ncbi:MAG: ParA family protein [Magnetococcales bacterium]|nr:ParA family protein [Magnetococcales bacterium]
MYTVSIFNNKGGVGKSTLTVFMADFLATLRVRERHLRVLVIDMDAQGSCATSLLGSSRSSEAKRQGHTLARLANAVKQPQADITPYLIKRPRSRPKGRTQPLPELSVVVPDRGEIFAFEANPLHHLTLLRDRLIPALEPYFDFVLIDQAGNVDARNLMAINGLVMSDAVLVPVEPSRISLNAMPDTMETIRHARERGDGIHPELLGLVLNKADRRTKQFKLHLPDIQELARALETPWFENHLPNAPGLASATDDSLAFESLRERYGGYYEQIRKVVKEVLDRLRTLQSQHS